MVQTSTSLTYTVVDNDIECPPIDQYILELKSFTGFATRSGYRNQQPDDTIVESYSDFYFQIVDYDYDDEEDDRDWNGSEVKPRLVFFREDTKSGNQSETWKDERSNANSILVALLGHKPEEGEDFDLDDFVGKRIRATVEPNKKGWPTIKQGSAVPFRQKKKKAAPVVEADDVDEADEVNPFKKPAA